MLIIEKLGYFTNYLRAIEWFEEYFIDCVLMTELIEKFPNELYYWHKKDGIILQYNIKYKHFYVNYDKIWRIFHHKFSLNNMEINKLIASILEQHTKRKVVTINYKTLGAFNTLEQHIKRKVVTNRIIFRH